MTIPNLISAFRLLLVPAFVMCILYYATQYKQGEANEMLRWWATAIFVTAAISDGIDGYLARRLKQQSELGAVLDPLADKFLQVTALVLLSFDFHGLFKPVPLWLPILVISRDFFILLGFMVLRLVVGARPEINAHWSGKAATALTMLVITMVLMRWTGPLYEFILTVAGMFILLSLAVYVFRWIVFLNHPATRPAYKSAVHERVKPPGD